MTEYKSRPTFSIQFQIDPQYGPQGWYYFRGYNGFHLNFGVLYFAVWIQFVRKAYR